MTRTLPRALPWLIYPSVMTLAFALFALLQRAGMSLIISTYVPVLVTAALMAALESAFPHRKQWQPPGTELKTDLTFTVVVQLAPADGIPVHLRAARAGCGAQPADRPNLAAQGGPSGCKPC